METVKIFRTEYEELKAKAERLAGVQSENDERMLRVHAVRTAANAQAIELHELKSQLRARPVLVAKGAIISGESVLLGKRNCPKDGLENAGKWEIPGGKVEFGESPSRAVEREIHEELGLYITVGRMSEFVLSVVRTMADNSQHHIVGLTFECHWAEGAEARLPVSRAHSEVAWFTVQDVVRLAARDRVLTGTVAQLKGLGFINGGR